MRGLSFLALLAASPALAQVFPLTLEHRFGTTVIPEPPPASLASTLPGRMTSWRWACCR